MKRLPYSNSAFVIRTDFSEETIWNGVRDAIRAPVGDFGANVEFLDDPAYAGLTNAQLLELFSGNTDHTFVVVADQETMTHPEHPLRVVDLWHERGREFRAVPRQIQSIENNLSIANMDFDEFAESVDPDGIFRGFAR
jgi:hypothetical protein